MATKLENLMTVGTLVLQQLCSFSVRVCLL